MDSIGRNIMINYLGRLRNTTVEEPQSSASDFIHLADGQSLATTSLLYSDMLHLYNSTVTVGDGGKALSTSYGPFMRNQ
jgi:hypothetical protein